MMTIETRPGPAHNALPVSAKFEILVQAVSYRQLHSEPQPRDVYCMLQKADGKHHSALAMV